MRFVCHICMWKCELALKQISKATLKGYYSIWCRPSRTLERGELWPYKQFWNPISRCQVQAADVQIYILWLSSKIFSVVTYLFCGLLCANSPPLANFLFFILELSGPQKITLKAAYGQQAISLTSMKNIILVI